MENILFIFMGKGQDTGGPLIYSLFVLLFPSPQNEYTCLRPLPGVWLGDLSAMHWTERAARGRGGQNQNWSLRSRLAHSCVHVTHAGFLFRFNFLLSLSIFSWAHLIHRCFVFCVRPSRVTGDLEIPVAPTHACAPHSDMGGGGAGAPKIIGSSRLRALRTAVWCQVAKHRWNIQTLLGTAPPPGCELPARTGPWTRALTSSPVGLCRPLRSSAVGGAGLRQPTPRWPDQPQLALNPRVGP